MEMNVYNSLTRRVEPLVPLAENTVRLYTCGPTVYNFAHIGNFRAYTFEDILRRVIQFNGMKVRQVMNLTDVDDKTIKGANAQGVALTDYTKTYKDAFFADLGKLNVQPAEVYPAATDHIPEMIALVQTLMEKGVAYQSEDGSVYFAVTKFPGYGKLAHIDFDNQRTGARCAADEYDKENVGDFALWKAWEPSDGPVGWDSPWGRGRPGWHIECSAMSMKYLGETFDLHTGGIDNLFPHHENEIAQSEALTGKQFVKYWVHNGLIKVNGQKMSKSLGNSLLLSDLLKKYSNEAVKFALLQTNYRNDINITDNLFPEAERHLYEFYKVFCEAEEAGIKIEGDYPEIDEAFDRAMSDDFNTALALSDLYAFFKKIKAAVAAKDPEAGKMLSQVKKTYSLLGLFRFDPETYVKNYEKTHEEPVPENVRALAEKMQAARAAKDYALSDSIRAEILGCGYAVMISKDGVSVKKA